MSRAKDRIDEANIARNQGRGLQAATLYEEAITLAEAEGDDVLAADAAHMMGVVRKADNAYDLAIPALEDAKARYLRLGRKCDAGRVERDIGIMEDYADHYPTALKSLERSVEALESCPDRAELGISESKIGWHYLHIGMLKQVRPWLEKGLEHIREQGNWFYEMTTLWHLAVLDIKTGEHGRARDTLTQAIELVRVYDHDHRHGRRLAQLYGGLAICYQALGDEEQAGVNRRQSRDYLSRMSPDSRAVVAEELKSLR